MRVAITGGTGSLGGHLIARLASEGSDRIVTLTRCEQKRHRLQAQYDWHPGVKVYAGDIRDEPRLRDIFAGCEVVVHAAARKVVSGHHDEAEEMHKTNIDGTANVLAAARGAGVGKILFISSDKAVHPCNVYGVSKAMAEHLVISSNARSFASGTRASCIRYGNVIASNGSVVRIWKEKVAAGDPLPVSHPAMTRFWWTLDDAVDAVIRAINEMRGGEIFIPRMKAAPITTLLEAIAPGAQIETIGIRTGGEKLHESLLSEDEMRRARFRNDWIIIPPADSEDLWDRSPWLGDPVEQIEYRSDTWPLQWDVEGLREVLR